MLRNEYYDLDYGHTLAGLSVWNQFMSSSYVEVVTIKLGLETGSLLSGWDDYWAYLATREVLGLFTNDRSMLKRVMS